MGKFSQTWSLMSECWQVLKQDKTLVLFPLISAICCMLLMASFAVPIVLTGVWHPPGHEAAMVQQVAYYGTLFAFYVVNYFIVIFFNSALVACAAARLTGGTPTFGDGIRTALSRLPVIAGWALVSATVGLLLKVIEDRSDKIGQIVAGLIGMAWTVMTFLVVPVLVIENKGPIAALKESTSLLKKTWGEQVISNCSFGLIFFVLSLPAFLLVGLAIYVHTSVVVAVCLSLAVIYWVALALINSALHAIFQTALYLYARDGHIEGFNAEVLGGALR